MVRIKLRQKPRCCKLKKFCKQSQDNLKNVNSSTFVQFSIPQNCTFDKSKVVRQKPLEIDSPNKIRTNYLKWIIQNSKHLVSVK